MKEATDHTSQPKSIKKNLSNKLAQVVLKL